jgi:hypothetical protein
MMEHYSAGVPGQAEQPARRALFLGAGKPCTVLPGAELGSRLQCLGENQSIFQWLTVGVFRRTFLLVVF